MLRHKFKGLSWHTRSFRPAHWAYISLLTLFLTTICIESSVAQNIEKLPRTVNSELYDEVAPVLSVDGKNMYFTRIGSPETNLTLMLDGENKFETLSRNEFESLLSDIYQMLGGRDLEDPLKSSFNQDIWYIPITEDGFGQPIHPEYPLNSALPNSAFGISADSRELFVINQFFENGGMIEGVSNVRISEFLPLQFPRPIHIKNYYNRSSAISMTVSPDKEVLIMSLSRDNNFGEKDLFVAFKGREDVYSAPKNLGSQINTQFMETSPHLSANKKYLFFASDRDGTGNSNLYVSKRLDYSYTHWSPPRKIPGPINSQSNESHPFYNEITGMLYFVSDRDGGKDIFRADLTEFLAADDEVFVSGSIIDAIEGEMVPAHVYIYEGEINFGSEIGSYRSFFGQYRFPLDPNKEYKLLLMGEDFDYQEITLTPEDLVTQTGDKNLYKNLLVNVAEEEESIESILKEKKSISFDSERIRFIRSTAELLPGFEQIINELISVFSNNPQWNLEIIGHTDPIGPMDLLNELSVERAQTIKNLLINGGIAEDRISIKGVGPSEPLNDNSTEELRAQNRRVEINVYTSDREE